VLVFMSGNDQLNESKLTSALGAQVVTAKPEELFEIFGANAGSLGPVNLKKKIKIIADKRLEDANGLYSGANKDDYHIGNVDFKRDAKIDGYFDLRTIEEGENCAKCGKPLRVVRAIELGHIFKLGTKYSQSMKAMFLDESGKEKPIIMGSYGIGIERIVACYLEQNYDDFGILWNKILSPYQIHLISVNPNNQEVVKKSEEIYDLLKKEKIETLFDDRLDASPGFKFKDADLLGFPVIVIVSEKNLKNGKIEIKIRRSGERKFIEIENAVSDVKNILSTLI
jgi:prolyl-tRNA synthetase